MVRRYGKNTDVVVAAITATLIDPVFALLTAAFGKMYTNGQNKKPVFPKEHDKGVKDIIYLTIEKHTDKIRKKLVEYGIAPKDADYVMQRTVYEGYIDGLLA